MATLDIELDSSLQTLLSIHLFVALRGHLRYYSHTHGVGMEANTWIWKIQAAVTQLPESSSPRKQSDYKQKVNGIHEGKPWYIRMWSAWTFDPGLPRPALRRTVWCVSAGNLLGQKQLSVLHLNKQSLLDSSKTLHQKADSFLKGCVCFWIRIFLVKAVIFYCSGAIWEKR